MLIFQRHPRVPTCLQVQSRPDSSRASSCPRVLSRNHTRERASSKLISELALMMALLPRAMVQFLGQLSGELPAPSRCAPWSWLDATRSCAVAVKAKSLPAAEPGVGCRVCPPSSSSSPSPVGLRRQYGDKSAGVWGLSLQPEPQGSQKCSEQSRATRKRDSGIGEWDQTIINNNKNLFHLATERADGDEHREDSHA